MELMNTIKSSVRHLANKTMRTLIRDEAIRKQLVEKHYAKVAESVNSGSSLARRSAYDLLDWRTTLGFRLLCTREVYRANSFYGIERAFRLYAGTNKCIKACIEHGVHFGKYTNEQELDNSGLPCLITFGSERYKHICEVSNTPVVMVGPYVAYAEDYLSQTEFVLAKNLVGKTLLVFPSHSVDRVQVNFEASSFLREIEKIRKYLCADSVLVCLYYRDLLNGCADIYEHMGYSVVTAGYREDALFLPRLRSIIQLADWTMSNSVGTHIGYCSYMGKPHYVYNQEQFYVANSAFDRSEFDNEFSASQAKEKEEVAFAFTSLFEKDDRKKKEVLNRYWGFDKVLSVDKMSTLYAVCELAYKERSRDRQKCFAELATQAGLVDTSYSGVM